MATRPLTNVEVPVLEPIRLEREPLALRRLRAAGSWARGAFVLDAAMLLAATLAAELGSRGAGIVRTEPVWLVVYAALVLLLLRLRGLYSWHVRLQALDDVRTVVTVTGLAAMALLTLRLVLPGDVDDLAGQSIRLWAFSAVYLGVGRIALDWAQVKARRQGETARPTLIVGAGRVGRLTAKRLLEHPEFGLQPIGFLDKEPLDEPGLPAPVLGASWELQSLELSSRMKKQGGPARDRIWPLAANHEVGRGDAQEPSVYTQFVAACAAYTRSRETNCFNSAEFPARSTLTA